MIHPSIRRSQEEILAYLRSAHTRDWLGWANDDLIECLDYEHAKEFLKPEFTSAEWNAREVAAPRERMTSYLPFAWEKANNCRGLSAARSLNHFHNWLWLLGEDELAAAMLEPYEHYGKAHLIRVCEYLGLDPKTWDDGVRVNSEKELERRQ